MVDWAHSPGSIYFTLRMIISDRSHLRPKEITIICARDQNNRGQNSRIWELDSVDEKTHAQENPDEHMKNNYACLNLSK